MDVVKRIEDTEPREKESTGWVAPDESRQDGQATLRDDNPVDGRRATASPNWPVWLRVTVAVVVLAALAAPLVLFREFLFNAFQEPERVTAAVQAAGAWGPLVIVALAIAQTIIAPIPGQVVNFVSGYIYGLWPGMLYSWIGLVLGTTMAMGMARYAGRPVVEHLVGRKILDRVDRAAAGRGLSFFFLFFLIPGLPDDVLCFVAGFTALPLRALVPISAFARIPGLLGSAWLGAEAHSLPPAVWILLGLAGLITTYVVWRHGEQLQEQVLRWLNTR
jgi:uncharacterized membrane protein YdjX (TVP38/TMEM64 family)